MLHTFCQNNKLAVNTEKTKVIVFKKGGQLSRKEKWFYNGNNLEVIHEFCYIGVFFTNRLSLYKMAENMCAKAQRVLAHLFNSFGELPYLPAKTFFKVFDAKICSILMYGSEIWGLKPRQCVEHVQMYACKRFLNVSQGACNDAVLGDLGRFPMHIYTAKRCIAYWLRILSLPDSRYDRMCYNMLKYYDSIGQCNWVTDIKHVLYSSGFGYV